MKNKKVIVRYKITFHLDLECEQYNTLLEPNMRLRLMPLADEINRLREKMPWIKDVKFENVVKDDA